MVNSANHPEDAQIHFFTGTYFLMPRELLGREIVELDLGCGCGSYTCELAKRFPERQILAADVMIGRLRKVVKRANRMELENLAVLRTEARHLIALMMPDRSLDRIHLLCPDPWPKDRHKGHRLLASDFLSQLHRVLKDDGIFHFSSDDVPYCEAVEKLLLSSDIFVSAPEAIEELKDIKSDFERRWNDEGKAVKHIAFRKVPRPFASIGH